jgi:hypothetical protein
MSARPSLPTKTAESIRAMDGDALVPSPPSPSIESSIASTSSTSTSTLTSTSSSRRNRSDVVSIHRVPSADDALDDTNLSENSVFVSVKFAEAASAVRLGVPARVNCGVLKALAMQHFRSAALIPTLASNNDADYGLYNSAAPNKAHNARLAEERALALVADAAFVIREEIALRISVPEVAQSLRLPPLLWPLDEPLAQVQSVALARTELGDSSQFFGLYCNSVIVGDNDNRGDFEQIDGKRTARSYAWSRAAGVALVLRREAPIDVVLPNGDKLNKSLALGEPPLTLLKQIDEHWAAHIKPRTLPRKSRKDGSGTSMVASPPTSPRMTRDEAAAPQRFAFYGTTSVAVSSRVAEREPLPLTTDVTKRQTWYYCREIVLTAHVPTLGMKTLVPLHADMRVSDAIPQLLKRMHISVDPSTMALYRTHKCDEAFAEDATLAACQFDSGGNVYLRQKVKLNLLSSPSSARRQKPNRDRRVSLLPRAAMQNSTRALWTMPGDERIVSVLSKAALDDGAVPEQRRIVSEKETTLRRHLETASRDACARLLVTARVSAQLPRVVLAQSVVRGWLARRAVAEMRAREAKRKQVAVELRDTERSYVTGIKLLVSAYKVPLEHQLEHGEQAVGAGAPIVTRQHIDKLFLNIEDICEQTDKLLYALEGRMQRFQVATRVGDIFVQLVPSLALYSVYNAGYPESQSTYRSLSSNRKFAAFMDAQRMLAADQSKLDFISLSIMPIQRVPRYRMLLGELHKYTAPDHPDYAPLASALRDVAKLADDINESIRAAESDEHVRQLQRKLVGLDFPLLQPGRVFVREGVLDKVCKKDVKPRHFYLFNDMLLYANDTMGQLRLSKVFPIAEGLSIGESTRERAFQIITPKKSFLVIAADNHKRADWIRALQSVVKRDAARKADAERLAKAAAAAVAAAAADADDDDDDDAVDSVAAPVWVADKERANCMLCHRRFTKLTTRRHHCRGCGKLVCHKCSDHRVPLANIGKNCRVCDKCFVRYDANSSVVRDSQSVALFDVESDSSRGWVVPSGALECVLPWLASAADVCACACVSRAWAMAVAESDDVWRTLYKKAYERFALPAAPPTGTWREALRIKRALRGELARRRRPQRVAARAHSGSDVFDQRRHVVHGERLGRRRRAPVGPVGRRRGAQSVRGDARERARRRRAVSDGGRRWHARRGAAVQRRHRSRRCGSGTPTPACACASSRATAAP